MQPTNAFPGAASNASAILDTPTDWQELILRLVLALVGGLLVTGIYRGTRQRWQVSPTFPPTLVMLAILIATVAQVIGHNLALAFSLVGALSIVRFRTVVRDTQDTAFVIFAVVVGMAAGTGSWEVGLVSLAVGGLAAYGMAQHASGFPINEEEHIITLRVSIGLDAATLTAPAFAKHTHTTRTESILTGKQGAALDYTYRIRLKETSQPADLVKELNRTEGIQSVELRRASEEF